MRYTQVYKRLIWLKFSKICHCLIWSTNCKQISAKFLPSNETSTISNYSVLVLNTYKPVNVPLVIHSDGQVDTNIDFTLDPDTSVYQSCSLKFKNQHLIFGGEGIYRRQISRIIGCRLQRVGELPFDLRTGACTTIDDHLLYLCFNYGGSEADTRRCRYTTEPEGSYENATLCKTGRPDIRIAASSSKVYPYLLTNSSFF